MKLKRKTKSLVLAASVGAAFAYLMDPVEGRKRRDALARRTTRRVEDLRDLADKAGDIREAVGGGDEDVVTTSDVGGAPAVPGFEPTADNGAASDAAHGGGVVTGEQGTVHRLDR